MGTNNSRNPVYFENGLFFRATIEQIKTLREKNKQYIGNDKADKAHDLLLARHAILEATQLTNDLRLSDKNDTAKEFVNEAISQSRFNRFFDLMIRNERRY